jgi:thiamine biosynthesis protein ThiS
MKGRTMKITYNGKPVEVPEGTTIKQFIDLQEIKNSVNLVFELDGELVHWRKWDTAVMEEGSEIESEFLAGGGSV